MKHYINNNSYNTKRISKYDKKDNIFLKIVKFFSGNKPQTNPDIRNLNVRNDTFNMILNSLQKLFDTNKFDKSLIDFKDLTMLYDDYDTILDQIPKSFKQIKRIVSYVLLPDSLEQNILNYNFETELNGDYVSNILSYLEIEDMLNLIQTDMFIYGDQYVRIHYKPIKIKHEVLKKNLFEKFSLYYRVQYKKRLPINETLEIMDKKNLIMLKEDQIYQEYDEKKNIIIENQSYSKSEKEIRNMLKEFLDDDTIQNNNMLKENDFLNRIEIDNDSFGTIDNVGTIDYLNKIEVDQDDIYKPEPDIDISDEELNKSVTDYQEIVVYIPYKLEKIDSRKVIKLESYGIKGYLIIHEEDILTNDESMDYQFSTFRKKEKFNYITQIKDFIMNEYQLTEEELENHEILRQILIYDDKGDLKLEFVPFDEIVDFKNDISSKYRPYGMSLLDNIRPIQRKILLMELQSMIYKINRSQDRRMFRVDVSDIDPSEIPQFIESIKQKLKNDIDIDLDGSLRQIPQMMSILDDYWIPVMNDKPLYEIDTLSGGEGGTNYKDDLEYLNRQLLSGLFIPQSYISEEDNSQSGSTILQQDEQFQRDVLQFQSFIEKGLDDLVYYILNRLNQIEFYERKQIRLNKPEFFTKLLEYEIKKSKLEYQTQLKDYGIPDKYVLKEILGFTDDDLELIEKYKKEEEIQNNGNDEEEM